MILNDLILCFRKTEKEYVFADILDDVNIINETDNFTIDDNQFESIEETGIKVEESKKKRKTAIKR